MGDEQNRSITVPQLPHDIEYVFRLIRRQGGGDLIEHQQLGVTGQRPGQVEQAEHRQRHVAHQQSEIDLAEIHTLQPRAHVLFAQLRDPQVLLEGEIRDQGRILEYGGDPGGHRLCRSAQERRFAVDGNRDPESAGKTPERIFTKVLLPAPFAPSRAWISPDLTVRSADRIATTDPNRLEIPPAASNV